MRTASHDDTERSEEMRDTEEARFAGIEKIIASQLKLRPANRLDNSDNLAFLIRLIYRKDAKIARLEQESSYFRSEYQDDAGMSMMREQQGFLLAEIVRLRDRGLPQIAFGLGNEIVDSGLYKGKPAVFIAPAIWPGEVGASSARENNPTDQLTPGELVLTFPTEEQAKRVAEALVGSSLAP